MNIDSPDRADQLREILRRKTSLRALYNDTYRRYAECLSRCPADGIAVELGSGGGFVQEVIGEMVTSDLIPYPGVDQVVDALNLPFEDGSVRCICMLNVFHHIPDVERFLREATRVLAKGGRLLIADQHLGWISRPILRFVHHEPYDASAPDWSFESDGPLSGANGALTWLVFRRDRKRFEATFPHLRVDAYRPHTPLRYWLAGGLKSWSLLPGWAFGAATSIDRGLAGLSEHLCSFVDVELVRL